MSIELRIYPTADPSTKQHPQRPHLGFSYLDVVASPAACLQRFRSDSTVRPSEARGSAVPSYGTVRDQLSTSIRGYAKLADWTASAPLHGTAATFTTTGHATNHERKKKTSLNHSDPKGGSVIAKKRLSDVTPGLPRVVLLPSMAAFAAFCRSPERSLNRLNSERKYQGVVHETKLQTPAPCPPWIQ